MIKHEQDWLTLETLALFSIFLSVGFGGAHFTFEIQFFILGKETKTKTNWDSESKLLFYICISCLNQCEHELHSKQNKLVNAICTCAGVTSSGKRLMNACAEVIKTQI